MDADTPLSRALSLLEITQKELCARTGLRPPNASKLVNGRDSMSKRMAVRIVEAIDPERKLLNELHLLYPERYRDWQP